DGGKNERRELRPIDDIDGDAVAAGARGDLSVERVAGRGNHGHGIAQVGLERIAKADFEPALCRQRQQLFGAVRLPPEPADVRAGGTQQTQLAERGLARAHDDDDASGGIEEHRKEPHRASSAKTLTSIIFYIIVEMSMEIEKYCSESANRNRKYHHGRMR